MGVILTSIVLGIGGTVATRIGLEPPAFRRRERDPHVDWLLGLIALLPAWLVVFIGLLPSSSGRVHPQLAAAASWTLSAAAALLGAIVTEGRVRAHGEGIQVARPDRLWWLGVLALVPAWGIALIGYAVTSAFR